MASKTFWKRLLSLSLRRLDLRGFDLRGLDARASAVLLFMVPNFAVAVSPSIHACMVPSSDMVRDSRPSARAPCRAKGSQPPCPAHPMSQQLIWNIQGPHVR